MMNAEIISIGDELLIGQVINTNSSWIEQQLNRTGIKVYQITTISDSREQILNSIQEAQSRSDIILITGGLGPTNDDITKQVLCEYFKTFLIFNEQAYNDIKKLFKQRGFKVTKLNKKQAELPENCLPIRNTNGTASGMWFEKNGKIFVSMPGVPFEMKHMITDFILPKLTERFKTDVIIHKTILTQGVGESFLSDIISDWEEKLPDNIKLAYLPQPGLVRLRLSAIGKDKNKLQKQIDNRIVRLNELIHEMIFGYDDDTLEGIIGKLLKEKNKSLSTAESCTGGYIAHLITSIPGSSYYYKGSVIAYSNEIKKDVLGVKNNSLIKYGAVSEQVVTEMVTGIKRKFNTDFAIATSGIAGPDGGTIEKPVGTIWIAVATPEKLIVKKFLFGEHRQRNIRKTALSAMNLLRKGLITE